MRVFRGEALLDVIFAASAILLIFLLLLQPGLLNTNFYRQANLAVGCFGAKQSGNWNGELLVYRPGGSVVEPTTITPKRLKKVIRGLVEQGAESFRIAVMIDGAGGKCYETFRNQMRSMSELSDLKDIVLQVEAVPCASRDSCEAKFARKNEGQEQ